MFRAISAAAVFCLLACQVWAQGAVQQFGVVKQPGNLAVWQGPGHIMDGGPPGSGGGGAVASVAGAPGQINATPTTGNVVISFASPFTTHATFNAGITVGGAFTAPGLVTNADLASPTITINTTPCTLGSSCTVSGGGGGGTPGGSSGQIQFNNSATFGGFTMGGDCTLSQPNILCTKTAGVAFATSATTDTTNASNIASGTLAGGRLPNPSASTLGGVQSFAPTGHTYLTTISTSGVPGGAIPTCADLSNAAASCSTDATNATNISTGTLASARMAVGSATQLGASGVDNVTLQAAAGVYSFKPSAAFGTPASSSAPCTQGQSEFDASFAYFCVASNTWIRLANGATW